MKNKITTLLLPLGHISFTYHGRDAYIHYPCLRYCHNFALYYQFHNSNLFTHRMLSLREPLVKPMAPGSIFHHIFSDL